MSLSADCLGGADRRRTSDRRSPFTVEFRPVEREPGAFQQSVTQEQVLAMCRRAFGDRTQPVSVVEFGLGSYNNTYRVDLGADTPVILRVAPEPSRQSRAERSLMRNEHASVPYLAPLAPLMPRTLMIDFTHQVIGRDYLFQTLLDGVTAPDRLPDYPRPQWAPFFAQLGTLSRHLHAVRGTSFGWVAGPSYPRWSEAFRGFLDDVAAAHDDAGLDASDIRETIALAARQPDVFDEITEPRLLHGDLWMTNVMISPTAPEPVVTGLVDCDRATWADPAMDFAIFRVSEKPGTERDAFWDTYGRLPSTPSAVQRSRFYRILHLTTLRFEGQRSSGGTASVLEVNAAIRDVIRQLGQE
jgi:aminoglycoside phosphotransferase (APT) family kinase protein